MDLATQPTQTMHVREVCAQPAWVVRSGEVELAVTQVGAQMAPVTFFRSSAQPVQPYYVSPWQGEGLEMPVRLLEPLRGDFFCLPFGGNGTPFNGEMHPPHGEPPAADWELVDCSRSGAATVLTVACSTQVRPGRVTRRFGLVEGCNAVYSATTIEGFAGPAPLGHHAILALPEEERAMLISTSRFTLGMTCPHVFSAPESREYQSLALGERFTELGRVPTLFRVPAQTDCSSYPARPGYADLLGLYDDPANPSGRPSWVAAVNTVENWLWFALKDPAVLPARLFWMENHGRHGSPWNGRNRCLGLEDGCMYFDKGVAESAAENAVNREGIPTCINLNDKSPFTFHYIQGVMKVPAGFGRVTSAEFAPGAVAFTSRSGGRVEAPVRHEFLKDGKL